MLLAVANLRIARTTTVGIVTVLGSMLESDLGVTLTHEHLFFDLITWLQKANPRISVDIRQRVTLRNYDVVHRAPFSSRDNLVFSDVRVSIREVRRFKDAGGRTIVDLTTRGLKNNPRALKTVSERTGVNIIAGSGFYINAPNPEMNVDEMTDTIVRDIREGIDGTGIRAGLIGEIGCVGNQKNGLTRGDKKRLTASARAQAETGAPLNIHPPLPVQRGAVESVLRFVEREGADMKRITISHMDKPGALQHSTKAATDYVEGLASYGTFIGFDGFGNEWPWTYDDFGIRVATDYERVLAVKSLIGKGYLSRLLLSHDTCNKIHLREYGGSGYDHILLDVLPLMKAEGISEREIKTLLIENPKRFLVG